MMPKILRICHYIIQLIKYKYSFILKKRYLVKIIRIFILPAESEILNHFGFTILADLLDYIVSLPANCFEHLKAKITN